MFGHVLQPAYTCICDEGWTHSSSDPACNVDVNECDAPSPPCSIDPPVQCINLPGSFICGPCPPGQLLFLHEHSEFFHSLHKFLMVNKSGSFHLNMQWRVQFSNTAVQTQSKITSWNNSTKLNALLCCTTTILVIFLPNMLRRNKNSAE